MKIKKLFAACLVSVFGLALCGCQRSKPAVAEVMNSLPDTVVTEETSKAIPENQLASGYFYVVHNGEYYALGQPDATTYDDNSLEEESSVNPNRIMFFTTENEVNIPTLYVNRGDKLVYYSEKTLLDYIVWERYKDFGYTVGLYNIQTMLNGRCFIQTDEDSTGVLEATDLYSLYNLSSTNILFDKIGQVELSKEYLENGMIKGLLKGQKYDTELYVGSIYHYQPMTANVHAFNAMEMFGSIKYKTMQEKIYEIEIPDYFVTGYYSVNGYGFVRIVLEQDWQNGMTDFNVPLLVLEQPEGETVYPRMYSDFEPLNYYATTVEGTLGYDEMSANALKFEEETKKQSQGVSTENVAQSFLEAIRQSNITQKYVEFPKGVKCTITIEAKEKTGFVYVDFNGDQKSLKRNGTTYTLNVTGNGRRGKLVIGGFFDDYTLTMDGCHEVSE